MILSHTHVIMLSCFTGYVNREGHILHCHGSNPMGRLWLSDVVLYKSGWPCDISDSIIFAAILVHGYCSSGCRRNKLERLATVPDEIPSQDKETISGVAGDPEEIAKGSPGFCSIHRSYLGRAVSWKRSGLDCHRGNIPEGKGG